MLKSVRFLSGVFIASTLLCVPAVVFNAADDWPQWRGPNRDGVSAEKGLLQAWPAGGPPLAWTASGAGSSAIERD